LLTTPAESYPTKKLSAEAAASSNAVINILANDWFEIHQDKRSALMSRIRSLLHRLVSRFRLHVRDLPGRPISSWLVTRRSI
jgi:G:T-mismatch repair DNA endonuclease (very short patch repair protein)